MAVHGQALLECLHFVYPSLVFTYQLVSSCVAVITLDTLKAPLEKRHRHVRRGLVIKLMGLVVATFVAQLSAVVAEAIQRKQWLGPEDVVVQLLACTMIFSLHIGTLSQEEYPVWYPYFGCWVISLVFDLALLALAIAFPNGDLKTPYSLVGIVSMSLRGAIFIGLIVLYLFQRDSPGQPSASEDEESQPLLGDANGRADAAETGNQNGGYGCTTTEASNKSKTAKSAAEENPHERRQREARENMEKRLKEDGNWFTYIKRFMVRCYPGSRRHCL